MRTVKLTTLFFSLILFSCSSRYTTAPTETAQGYSDRRVSADRFLVSFRGNEHTSYATAREFALKRAAEITRLNGYTSFSIIEEQDISSSGISSLKGKQLQEVDEKAKQFSESQGEVKPLRYPGVSLLIECSLETFAKEEWIHALPRHSSPW